MAATGTEARDVAENVLASCLALSQGFPKCARFFSGATLVLYLQWLMANGGHGDKSMDNTKVTAEELKVALAADIDRLAEKIAAAMNAAKAGRIIADSEEPVRDAHAEFRQKAFEQALGLLLDKQEAFSPSGHWSAEQGQADHDAPDD